jgi:UDP-2-acetamido-3-amino-2,3-dideoxy-glucuronate N-acetyltransferase
MPDLIHPSSFVEDSEIGEGTKIWHFCHIHGAKIGKDCVIGQGCYIAPGVVIGNGVRIQNNVSVYTGVTIEDDVFVGPSVVFTNDLNPRAFLSKQGNYVRTLVEKGASIGANATIVCRVTIGMYSAVGAGSVVVRNVLPYTLVYGNPATERRRINTEWNRWTH